MNQDFSYANELKRYQVAGLFTLSFLGSIMHVIIHNLLAHGMEPRLLAEAVQMMKEPTMQIMFFVFTVLGAAPAFMAFVCRGKTSWRILVILAIVMLALNGIHYIDHMIKGALMNGGTTLVLQLVPGIFGVMFSLQYLKSLASE